MKKVLIGLFVTLSLSAAENIQIPSHCPNCNRDIVASPYSIKTNGVFQVGFDTICQRVCYIKCPLEIGFKKTKLVVTNNLYIATSKTAVNPPPLPSVTWKK